MMLTAVEQPTLQMVWQNDAAEIDLAPLQGLWSEEQYLRLTDQTNRLIELTDGVIEVIPIPTDNHQAISQFVFLAFLGFVQRVGGIVRYAPLRIRIREGKHREPDILLVLDANDPRRQNRYWLGADLVVEVVSPDNSERDTVTKRGDYAEAGIPEYWIVNPADATIMVLTLDGTTYAEHGVFGAGTTVTSPLLVGFTIDSDAVFAAE